MSDEGVALISRVALVAVAVLVVDVVRTLVGPSKRRGLHMQIGTLGGMTAGIAAASLTSRWVMTAESTARTDVRADSDTDSVSGPRNSLVRLLVRITPRDEGRAEWHGMEGDSSH